MHEATSDEQCTLGTRDGSTEPGESAAGNAEISLINEAVTADWNECQSIRERQTMIT